MNQDLVRTMPAEAFERLGDGQIAYVRPLQSEEVQDLFPQAPRLAPGHRLWALLSAEGRPILLTDTRAAAIANAHEHDLETLSVH